MILNVEDFFKVATANFHPHAIRLVYSDMFVIPMFKPGKNAKCYDPPNVISRRTLRHLVLLEPAENYGI